MHGILLVNKPQGLTSFDVVYQIKKKFKLKKVGHTGTLDPFATGLMIILCGNATKLAFLFNDLDKKYEGKIILNRQYDTYDTTGKLLDESDVAVSNEDVERELMLFPKHYHQVPPAFSAIKKNGQKAYDLARSGKEVVLDARPVDIYDFSQKSILDTQGFNFSAHVSKGTYLRSLAVDFAEKLGTYGALSQLNRTQIGKYHLKNARSIDEIGVGDLISDNQLFDDVDKLQLSDFHVRLVKNGIYLDQRQIKTVNPFVVVDQNQRLIAYYVPTDEAFKYRPVYFFGI